MDEKHSSWWWYSFSFPLWYALSCIHWRKSIYFINSFRSIVKIVFFIAELPLPPVLVVRTDDTEDSSTSVYALRNFCDPGESLLPRKKDLILFKLSHCCIVHSIIRQICFFFVLVLNSFPAVPLSHGDWFWVSLSLAN